MKYKLIAIDMDETLITSDKIITERSKEAMLEAEAAGAYVVLASGRMAANVKELYEPLGLSSPCICGGGSQVVDKDFNYMHTCYIEPALAKRVLDFAKELDVHVQIFDEGDYIFPKYTEYVEVYRGISGLNPVENPDMFEMEVVNTPKILVIAEHARILEIQPMFQERFPELNIGRSRPTFLEMNNPMGNKGVALKVLAEKLGLKQEELIAIGDNQIDASMIEYAGLGVAIGNALDEIKEIADYVSADNNNEGVTEVIEKFILEK
ncbi:MAG: Cof-type HAD-IIB family hydrolase [Christensenellaceae bacterium]